MPNTYCIRTRKYCVAVVVRVPLGYDGGNPYKTDIFFVKKKVVLEKKTVNPIQKDGYHGHFERAEVCDLPVHLAVLYAASGPSGGCGTAKKLQPLP